MLMPSDIFRFYGLLPFVVVGMVIDTAGIKAEVRCSKFSSVYGPAMKLHIYVIKIIAKITSQTGQYINYAQP